MLLHKSKWHFIQLILVIEQQLSYSIFLCTPGMRSLWPMRKEGGEKNRKHHYLTAAYCSLFLERYHCILFQSTAANTAIVEFSIFQKMSPKRVRYKQPMRELPRADEVIHRGSHKQFWVPLLYFYARDCSHIRNSNRWKLGQLQGEEENASGKSTLAHSSRPQLRQGEFQGDSVVTG